MALRRTLAILNLFIGISIPLQGFADTPMDRLQDALDAHIQTVQAANYDIKTCGPNLWSIKQLLDQNPWKNYSNKTLQAEGAELIQKFWKLRWSLHQKLQVMGPECREYLRDIFTRLRAEEDYLTEFAYPGASLLHPESVLFQKEPVPILEQGEYEANFVAPGAEKIPFQFQSGDVALARGTSFVSAIISRLSTHPSSFSHTLLWSVDPRTQELSSIEAYLSLGVQKFDYKYALRNENVRLAVFRPKNPEVGARAASVALSYADQNIPYDYKLDFSDKSAMSCVEVATSAYAEATQNRMRLPLSPSQVGLNSDNFLKKLQIKKGNLILPGDFELDPRFELVLEWRDNRVIRDSRHKDAILSELIRWMDELHYEFHATPRSLVAAYVLRPAKATRLWPMIQKLTGIPDINAKMPAQTLGAMTVLNDVGALLLEKLRDEDRKFGIREGRPMTDDQLREALEKIRVADLALFKNRQRSEFHGDFRAQ